MLRFLVLATLVVVPLRLAFVHSDQQQSWGLATILYADVALDVLCVLDVLSNFSFGFVTVNVETARREVVSDWRRIAIRYLRKTCALEVLSIGIPFESTAQRSFETQLLSLFKLLRVQRWLRVRARERHRAHEVGRMPRHVVVEKLSNIVALLILFLAWSHLTCCICEWHYTDRTQATPLLVPETYSRQPFLSQTRSQIVWSLSHPRMRSVRCVGRLFHSQSARRTAQPCSRERPQKHVVDGQVEARPARHV